MPNFICLTCGTQYACSQEPPAECTVCQDERQYVKATGQHWMTLERLRLTNRLSIRSEEPGLIGIGIEPHFAIGQRALLVRTPSANVLWDCVSLIDEALVAMVKGLGGISAIAISHPHYYSSMVEWSRAFGGTPIYLALVSLDYFLPGVLEEIHQEWNEESLDGIFPVLARKTAEGEAEIYGQCVLITDQTLTPIHIRLQIDLTQDEVSWLELRLGSTGDKGMVRRPYKLRWIADVPPRPGQVEWAYQVTFGDKRPS